jgi:aminopeptidase N
VIPLRVGHVKLGWNKVSLKYFTPYNNNRVGLHSFIDQQDKKQYLYSQFEAYHCFRVFPCFDQPNLKAKMTLSLTIPDDWIAVGNEKEVRYDHAAKEGKRVLERFGTTWFLDFYADQSKVAAYAFDKTPKISTYLYALCAGPYRVFEDYDPMYVPQRVYVRESLVENLRYELIMGITKTTLDLYQKTYGHRYPFSKVDHVMCPDYKFGAMENVGCITYSDGIMCSSKTMSIPQLTFFCVVIQHELAHMWFGNLITMQWWNDLWLNESFATALSYYACSFGGKYVEEFKDESWLHFANYKRWGLIEDLLPSNHNIEANCESTDVSESLIDGITYGKGASLLK